MRTNFRRVWCGLLLAALACTTTSYGERAARIRQAFLQLDEREVLICLGPPSDYDYPDEQTALWAYAYPTSGSAGVGTFRIGQGPTVARKTREFLTHPLDADLPAGFCRLTITLVSGQVTDLMAEGRNASGLNSDGECVYTVRICVE